MSLTLRSGAINLSPKLHPLRDRHISNASRYTYPGAIKAELGEGVRHRTSRYLNNHLEQDHRGIKGRHQPMRGFKSVASAHRFCRAYDEVHYFLRSSSPRGRRLSLDDRRWFHLRQVNRLLTIMEQAAA